jgi:serine/threonine protein kinase
MLKFSKWNDPTMEQVLGVMFNINTLAILTQGRPHTLKEALKIPDRSDEAFLIMMGLVDTITYMHKRGYVHRNLKPSVVAYNEERRETVWVCDLRFMTTTIDFSKDPVAKTNKYIIRHPTWLAGDTRQDVFALGSMMLEMAVGSLDFHKRVRSGKQLRDLAAKLYEYQTTAFVLRDIVYNTIATDDVSYNIF